MTTIPQVFKRPLIGNIPEIRRDRLKFFQYIADYCGDVGVFYFGMKPVVMLNAPDYIQSVLVEQTNCLEKTPRIRGIMQRVLGQSIFTLEGEDHRLQRRVLAPAFQPRQLQSYVTNMVECIIQMIGGWKEATTIDLHQEMLELTLRITQKTLFGNDDHSQFGNIRNALQELGIYTNKIMTSLIATPLTWPTPGNRRFHAARAVLDATVEHLIAVRRRENGQGNDVISMVLRNARDEGTEVSNEVVRDHIMALFFAAHETTAAAVTWAWYLLALHPAIYDCLQKEVDTVLGGRRPTFDNLSSLSYTLQVVKETLRLFPPAYVLTRKTIQPIMLPNRVQLPKGSILGISPYVLHRRATLFPQPDVFDPTRFTSEAEQARPRHAYLPFGAGPHTCIGNHFALMEAQLILATIVQRVNMQIDCSPRLDVHPLIVLHPKNPLHMIVTHRN
jgi:cytochrome P450